jgi:hypothetical protein
MTPQLISYKQLSCNLVGSAPARGKGSSGHLVLSTGSATEGDAGFIDILSGGSAKGRGGKIDLIAGASDGDKINGAHMALVAGKSSHFLEF